MNNEEILLLVCIILAVLTIVISFYGCSFYVFEKFEDDDTEEALNNCESELLQMLKDDKTDKEITAYIKKNIKQFDKSSFDRLSKIVRKIYSAEEKNKLKKTQSWYNVSLLINLLYKSSVDNSSSSSLSLSCSATEFIYDKILGL